MLNETRMNDLGENRCQLEDVAAYLDGELSGAGLTHFEAHLQTCGDCASELRAQRQLLCTLEVAFNGSRSFSLPKNFARVVTARAESDLSGMRNRSERRRAAKLCAVLALVSFALLGAAARTVVFDPIRSSLRITGSLIQLVWQAASEAAVSAAVVGRVIARAVLLAQNGVGLFLLAGFLLSVSFLPLLLARYHRAQTIE
ncbi:MAG TPA: zf-HC2 domain-containing protein [Pyrinomonadaceae bacterium]|nr:zf-HC2 domain-containing protein [Pyrinomonadaceae bacterium]